MRFLFVTTTFELFFDTPLTQIGSAEVLCHSPFSEGKAICMNVCVSVTRRNDTGSKALTLCGDESMSTIILVPKCSNSTKSKRFHPNNKMRRCRLLRFQIHGAWISGKTALQKSQFNLRPGSRSAMAPRTSKCQQNKLPWRILVSLGSHLAKVAIQTLTRTTNWIQYLHLENNIPKAPGVKIYLSSA